MKNWKMIRLLAAAAGLCLLFGSCSAGNGSGGMKEGYSGSSSYSPGASRPASDTADYDTNYGLDGGVPGETAAEGMGSSEDPLAGMKIIQYMDYRIETLEFDQSVSALEDLCSSLGGYIEQSSRSGESINSKRLRDAEYTLRIPSSRLEDFKSGAAEIGTVYNSSVWTENVTESYYDTESRLKSLRVQEERLLALMEKSETLTDVIQLEQALADVTYEIESLTSSLRRYDSLVDYSTVTVHLDEVERYTETPPVTLGERIADRFSATMHGLSRLGEELLIALIGGLPVIILLAILFCAIFFPVRIQIKKNAAKAKTAPRPQPPQPPQNGQPMQPWQSIQPQTPPAPPQDPNQKPGEKS